MGRDNGGIPEYRRVIFAAANRVVGNFVEGQAERLEPAQAVPACAEGVRTA